MPPKSLETTSEIQLCSSVSQRLSVESWSHTKKSRTLPDTRRSSTKSKTCSATSKMANTSVRSSAAATSPRSTWRNAESTQKATRSSSKASRSSRRTETSSSTASTSKSSEAWTCSLRVLTAAARARCSESLAHSGRCSAATSAGRRASPYSTFRRDRTCRRARWETRSFTRTASCKCERRRSPTKCSKTCSKSCSSSRTPRRTAASTSSPTGTTCCQAARSSESRWRDCSITSRCLQFWTNAQALSA